MNMYGVRVCVCWVWRYYTSLLTTYVIHLLNIANLADITLTVITPSTLLSFNILVSYFIISRIGPSTINILIITSRKLISRYVTFVFFYNPALITTTNSSYHPQLYPWFQFMWILITVITMRKRVDGSDGNRERPSLFR